ncbi:hypothetical protein P4V43_07390 [Brevibacillus fortis]|uniref:Prolipoprotein diacylglyceryl transferase n=1 Tax=Brevibacillus fortis TaxID=2126352 RepID=A0A2P7VHD7_9BACL|nr:hypothetical protein [Brevibacillus fortis]MED1781643.1 hypothetical protein [Brevibacillus fortis]PSJ98560.1 hypothetical protein C7R93_06360 [Brevibacillus fortis]
MGERRRNIIQDVIIWGPLIIKYECIAIALSALTAYMSMKYWMKNQIVVSKLIMEDIANVLFWAFLIWKFSVILFNPVSVLNNPYYLLYFTGGERGIWLAAIVVLCFLYIQSQRRTISFWLYAAVMTVGLFTYQFVYSLFPLLFNHPMQSRLYDLSQLFLAIVLLIWMYRTKERIGNPHVINQLILWYSMGQIFSGFLKGYSIAVFLGLSREQLFFLAITLCCWFFQNLSKERSLQES